MAEYRWLLLSKVEKALPAMEAEGVSKVARGVSPSSQTSMGFIEAYRESRGSPRRMASMPATARQSWAQRRQGFIKRHLGAINKNKTPLFDDEGIPTRQLLGLIAWAYVPPAAANKLHRWYVAGAPARVKLTRRNAAALAFDPDAPLPPTAMIIPLPDAPRRLFLQVARAAEQGKQLQGYGDQNVALARSLVRMKYLRITHEYGASETVHGMPAVNLALTVKSKRLLDGVKTAEAKEAAKRQTSLF